MSEKIIVDYLRGERTQNVHDPNKTDRGKPYGVVVAFIKDEKIFYGISLCHRNDVFSIKRGREIATERARKKEHTIGHYEIQIFRDCKKILEGIPGEKKPHPNLNAMTVPSIKSGEFNTHLKIGNALVVLGRVEEIAKKIIEQKEPVEVK